ncbi:hypothetical protein WR25_00785 [Diploscapter pachys]|uniref:Zinc finger ZPR1-type domain-containing protein n=1 Tax=Diploscapter pachys TaxID=2018661 RepID=A0A2A2KI56_9BILA|nr:hypothetical protein WR25_00785 [Diploscapter pachys]
MFSPEDLTRDVLKSDTCNLPIPELDLNVGYGALSSRFTTVEGLLTATKEQIDMQSSFFMGDSTVNEEKANVKNFLEQLDKALALKLPVTIVLDNPAENSYIQMPLVGQSAECQILAAETQLRDLPNLDWRPGSDLPARVGGNRGDEVGEVVVCLLQERVGYRVQRGDVVHVAHCCCCR